jgi:hypothetical protein
MCGGPSLWKISKGQNHLLISNCCPNAMGMQRGFPHKHGDFQYSNFLLINISTITIHRGQPQTKLQLSGSGCGMGEKDARMWGQHNIYWSLYRGGLPGSGTSQGAVQPSTGRSSLGNFDLRRLVQRG